MEAMEITMVNLISVSMPFLEAVTLEELKVPPDVFEKTFKM